MLDKDHRSAEGHSGNFFISPKQLTKYTLWCSTAYIEKYMYRSILKVPLTPTHLPNLLRLHRSCSIHSLLCRHSLGCHAFLPNERLLNRTVTSVLEINLIPAVLDNLKVNIQFRNFLARKSCYRASFFPCTVPEWNHLPLHIRNASSIVCFKSSLMQDQDIQLKGCVQQARK